MEPHRDHSAELPRRREQLKRLRLVYWLLWAVLIAALVALVAVYGWPFGGTRTPAPA